MPEKPINFAEKKPKTLQDIINMPPEKIDELGLPEEKAEKIKETVEIIQEIEKNFSKIQKRIAGETAKINNTERGKIDSGKNNKIFNAHFESIGIENFDVNEKELYLLKETGEILSEIESNFDISKETDNEIDNLGKKLSEYSKESGSTLITGYLSNLAVMIENKKIMIAGLASRKRIR